MRRVHIGPKSIRIILILILICIIAAVVIQNLAVWEHDNIGVIQENSIFNSYIFPAASVIQNGGESYVENKELITILLLGIDTPGEVVASGSYNNSQQADFIALIVIDPETNECTLLHINRDTMTDITVLGVTGQAAGTTYGQIALAHTYGSGLQDSCKNTVDSVSSLLYGINIDYFISINMDAVAVLNDKIGGVTVKVQNDFSQVDPTLTEGDTVTLMGVHALNYVRARQGLNEPTNLSRMERQRQYIDAFFNQLQDKLNSNKSGEGNLILSMFESASDYIVTDCPLITLSSLSDRFEKISEIKTETLAGTVKTGEFVEFYPDQDKLFELTMNTFFKKTPS